MRTLIISSSEGMTLMLLRSLQSSDKRVFVFSLWEREGFSRLSRYCDGYKAQPLMTCSESAIGACLASLNECIRLERIDTVVPSGIWATCFLASVIEKLNAPPLLPLPDPELIYRLNNKWYFFELLRGLGSPTPNTIKVLGNRQIQKLGVKYPVIIKPSIGGNSIGVALCHSQSDLEAYLLSSDNQADDYLIQNIVKGKDAVFAFVAYQGEIKGWTLHVKEERFIRFISNPEILQEAEKIISAIGYSGTGNLDLMMEEGTGKFYFLECNPRIWASFGISCAYGVDFIDIGHQFVKGTVHMADTASCVTEELEVPYPSTGRFLRGWLLGAYPLWRGKSTEFAWRTLCDPLPTIMARLQNAKGAAIPDDTDMLEQYHRYLELAK